MDFSQYTRITIPQGSVTQITDSGNNIIWKEGASAYRQLAYLEGTNIAYGFDSKVKPGLNSYMIVDFEHIDNNGSGQMGRGAVSNNQRFAIGFGKDANNNYTYFGGLGASWNTFNNYTSGKHKLGVQGPQCNVLNNAVGTSITKKGYLIDDTFNEVNNTVNSTTWYTAYLFGSRGNTNDANAGQGIISGKFYYAEIGYTRTDNYAQGINNIYYPAQRKSDGQLGIVRLNDSGAFVEFLTPRSGETGTYTAGPTVCENPMWQRSIYSNAGGSGTYWYSGGHGAPWTHEETILDNIPVGAKVLLQITAKVTTSGASDSYGKISLMGTEVRSISGTSTTTATYTVNQVVTIPSSSQYLFTASTGHTGYNSSGAYSRIQVQYISNSIMLKGGGNYTSTQTSPGVSQMYDIKITVL